jgi:hypothetical protein
MDCSPAGCGKTQMLSFRGAFFAEESLFFRASTEERFLASLGMTVLGTFSAACWGIVESLLDYF